MSAAEKLKTLVEEFWEDTEPSGAECPRCGHVTTMSTDPGPRSLAGDSGDTGAEVIVPGRGSVLSGETRTRSAAPPARSDTE